MGREKKLSSKVSSPVINKICKISSENGAYGTKLLGSGVEDLFL